MSKQALQKAAFDKSGVTHEESLAAAQLKPNLFERLGGESGFEELTQLFYDRVFDDTDRMDFLGIFSSSTKSEARENLTMFLVQTFGGPPLYREKKGKYTRLVGRHANYNITHDTAKRWLYHMKAALLEHTVLKDDEEAREALLKYFTFTAHYIVSSMQYMRSDQLSGGTQIDAGRIW